MTQTQKSSIPGTTKARSDTRETTSKLKTTVAGVEGFGNQEAKVKPPEDATPKPAAELVTMSGGVETMGGSWTALGPDKVSEGALRGAQIVITFTPGATVDSGKIGITQTVKANRKNGDDRKDPKKQGTPDYGDDAPREARALGDGTNLDKAAGHTSPCFAGKGKAWSDAECEAMRKALVEKEDNEILSQVSKSRIESQKKATSAGEVFGSRKDGKPPVAATLRDRAKLTWQEGESIDCSFETTAVSLDGPQAGVFYGTISWGYHVDEKGEVTVNPIALVRIGTPTAKFRESTEKWNSAEGYTLSKNYEKSAIKKGGSPTLLSDAGKEEANKKSTSLEWGKVDVKVAGNDELATTAHESPSTMPTGKALTERIATLTKEVEQLDAKITTTTDPAAQKRAKTDLANAKFELQVLSAKAP